MITSFRLRLALMSALLSGLVLASFGLGSLWIVRNAEGKKIEREIRYLLLQQLPLGRRSADWAAVEAMFKEELGVRSERFAAVRVFRTDTTVVYQSPWWPSKLKLPGDASGSSQDRISTLGDFGVFSEAQAADAPTNPPLQLAQGGPGSDGQRGLPPPGRPPPGALPPGALPPGAPTSVRQQPDALPSGEVPGASGAPGSLPDTPAATLGGEASGSTPATTSIAQPPVDGFPHGFPTDTHSQATDPTASGRRAGPPSQFPRNPVPSNVYQLQGGNSDWTVGVTSDQSMQLAFAVDDDLVDLRTRDTRNAFLFLLSFSLLLVGAGSWMFAGRAIQPLNHLTDVARRVTAEGLGKRIPNKESDKEFAELIDVFNKMLLRLDRSFKQAQRFSADAAHEIRTPLAIVQGQLERLISLAHDGSTIQANLTSILDEVRRLSTISSKLLLLAKADSGKLAVFTEVFDLSGALEDLIEDTRMLAPELQILGQVQPGINVRGDAALLRQLLHNLLSNAIKYNVPDSSGHGWVQIKTSQVRGKVQVTVANSGPGIPVNLQEKIFERFFRADSAHTRTVEGLGLGLSVAREIARAHGGELKLLAEAKVGVQFALLLPMQVRRQVANLLGTTSS